MAVVTPTLGRETAVFDGATELCWETFDLTYGNTSVDLTDNKSDGFRELMDIAGLKTRDISMSGKVENGHLRAWANDSGGVVQRANFEIRYDNGDILNFPLMNLVDYSESNPMNEASTYSASFQSSGAWVYTPA